MATKTQTASTTKAKPTTAQLIVLHPATNIPFNKLVLTQSNIRRINKKGESIEELADSIALNGLLQSLNVRPQIVDGKETGLYEVPAGGRRYSALKILVSKRKQLPDDAPVPCIVNADGVAENISLEENIRREQLHPLDELRAVLGLKDKNHTEEQIAEMRNLPLRGVKQLLRMATASPVLLKAYEKDEITKEELMTFCVTDDQKRQEQVYKANKGGHFHPSYIKRQLLENTVDLDNERVRFVGVKAFEAAGGVIDVNLFTPEGEGHIKDVTLLNKLVEEKFAPVVEQLKSAGWKWVETSTTHFPHSLTMNLDQLAPIDDELPKSVQAKQKKYEAELEKLTEAPRLTVKDRARIEELEVELNAIANLPPKFDKADMARAGVLVNLTDDGRLSIDYGYVKPEDMPDDDGDAEANGNALTNGADNDDEDGDAGLNGNAHEEDDAEPAGKPIPDRLTMDLTEFLTSAIRDGVAQDPALAYVAVLHAMCLGHFYHRSSAGCLQLNVQSGYPDKAPGLAAWAPTLATAARHKHWTQVLPDEHDNLWGVLLKMDTTDRASLFAHCASLAVNAVREPHNPRKEAMRHADQLAHELKLDMVKAGWTPTAESYLGRVNKGHIIEAVREAKGDETVKLIEHLKKEQMVEHGERLLTGTGWLPQLLRGLPIEPVAVADAPAAEALPDFMGEDTQPATAAA